MLFLNGRRIGKRRKKRTFESSLKKLLEHKVLLPECSPTSVAWLLAALPTDRERRSITRFESGIQKRFSPDVLEQWAY